MNPRAYERQTAHLVGLTMGGSLILILIMFSLSL
jgi:hypothetical protein